MHRNTTTVSDTCWSTINNLQGHKLANRVVSNQWSNQPMIGSINRTINECQMMTLTPGETAVERTAKSRLSTGETPKLQYIIITGINYNIWLKILGCLFRNQKTPPAESQLEGICPKTMLLQWKSRWSLHTLTGWNANFDTDNLMYDLACRNNHKLMLCS